VKKNINVVAALISENNKFLLCQRKKEDSYGALWEFPGGCVEDNESPQAAIIREIKEELDVRVGVNKVIGKFFDEDQWLKINIILFECFISSGVLRAKDCQQFDFFNLDQIPALDLAPADKKMFASIKAIYG